MEMEMVEMEMVRTDHFQLEMEMKFTGRPKFKIPYLDAHAQIYSHQSNDLCELRRFCTLLTHLSSN